MNDREKTMLLAQAGAFGPVTIVADAIYLDDVLWRLLGRLGPIVDDVYLPEDFALAWKVLRWAAEVGRVAEDLILNRNVDREAFKETFSGQIAYDSFLRNPLIFMAELPDAQRIWLDHIVELIQRTGNDERQRVDAV